MTFVVPTVFFFDGLFLAFLINLNTKSLRLAVGTCFDMAGEAGNDGAK